MGIYKRGEIYYVDFYVDGKRVRRKIGKSKTLALKALESAKADVIRGKYQIPVKKNKVLFEEFAKIYLDHVKGYKKSARSDGTSIRNMMPYFKGKKLEEIHPFAIETFKIKRRKEVKPASVNRELACLKHMYNMAIKWGYVKKNPVREVKLFKENNERLRYLSEEEEEALIEACVPHLRPIVIVALNTGMRKGEIFGLKWKSVDFRNHTIRIEKSKNNESRIVPMNELVYEVLRKQRKLNNQEYVFVNKNGKPYTDIKRSFKSALEKAGISDFRFHDLRHTFASNLVMSGADIVTVKELMGHKSIKMTMRYSHLSQQHKREVVEKLTKKANKKYSHNMVTKDKKGLG